jgi:hypothetical protein
MTMPAPRRSLASTQMTSATPQATPFQRSPSTARLQSFSTRTCAPIVRRSALGQSQVIEPVATRNVDIRQYLPGLAELWRSASGRQYGYPRTGTRSRSCSTTERRLDNATWKPRDGGTFERIVARRTIDKNGRRVDQPGVDPRNIAMFGLGLDPGGLTYGQTTWAGFARSLGFGLLDKNPRGTHLQLR